MADYIRREDAVVYAVSLIDRIYEGTVAPRDIRKEAKQQVINEMNSTDRLPAADMRENTPSSWKYNFNQNRSTARISCTVTCRNCHVTRDRLVGDVLKYCPNCGADMRGGEKDR